MSISSSCCIARTSTAGPIASRASPIVCFSALRVFVRPFIDSSAEMISARWESSVPITLSSEPSR